MSHRALGPQFEFVEDALSEEEMDHFIGGQCHALACAIHKRTGWPVVGLYSGQYEKESGNRGPYHYANRHPDGSLVDAEGKYAEEDAGWLHNWDDAQAMDVPVESTDDAVRSYGYAPKDDAAADKAVSRMLRKHP